jgi:hypothetical protein
MYIKKIGCMSFFFIKKKDVCLIASKEWRFLIKLIWIISLFSRRPMGDSTTNDWRRNCDEHTDTYTWFKVRKLNLRTIRVPIFGLEPSFFTLQTRNPKSIKLVRNCFENSFLIRGMRFLLKDFLVSWKSRPNNNNIYAT